MTSEDEAFRKFIVTSEDESSKENVSVNEAKTSERQYNLIEQLLQGMYYSTAIIHRSCSEFTEKKTLGNLRYRSTIVVKGII